MEQYISDVRIIVEQNEAGQVEQDIRPDLIEKVALYLQRNDYPAGQVETLDEEVTGQVYLMYDLLRVLQDEGQI